MLRVLGLALTAVLFVGCTTSTDQRQTNAASPTASATPTHTSPVSTATPTPSGPTTASVKTVGLKWQDDASGTPVTTIKVGGKVTWTAAAGPPHRLKRVASSQENGCDELEASFDTTGNLTPGQPVTRTFDKVGTFGYQCGVHGGTPNCKTPPGSGQMPGVIKVVP